MAICAGTFYKLQHLKSYFYEITHQYKGVIDYIVPYIQSKYEKPQDLVIATNYEEQVLMYYLESKVVVGAAGKNIDKDLKLVPDIVVVRKLSFSNQDNIKSFLKKTSYKKTTFDVYDYPVNNIPEIFYLPHHLFKTKYALSPDDALEIYEKVK